MAADSNEKVSPCEATKKAKPIQKTAPKQRPPSRAARKPKAFKTFMAQRVLHSCEICLISFLCKPSLEQHTSQEHPTVKLYNCHFCQLKFLSRDDLFGHFKKLHNTNKILNICSLCKHQVQQDLHNHLLKFHRDEDFIQTFAMAPLANQSKPVTFDKPKSKRRKLNQGSSLRSSKSEEIGLDDYDEILFKRELAVEEKSVDINSSDNSETCNDQEIEIKEYNPEEYQVVNSEAFDIFDSITNQAVERSQQYETSPQYSNKNEEQDDIPKAKKRKRKPRDRRMKDIPTILEPPTCLKCNIRFLDETFLFKHILNDHFEPKPVSFKPYHCHICFCNLSSRKSLREHRRLRHPTGASGDIQCSLCPRQFSNRVEYFGHYNGGHAGLNFHCGDCKIKFKTEKELADHLNAMQHQAQTSVCRVCFEEFISKVELQEHQSLQHPNIRDKHCLVCDRKFETSVKFWRHVGQVHGNKNAVQCEHCWKGFQNNAYLNEHKVRVHSTSESRHRCDHCSKSFTYPSSLSEHVAKSHPLVAPTHHCSICNLQFKLLRLLRDHENTVHDAGHVTKRKPIVEARCDVCDKSFCRKSYLKQHKEVVHEEKKVIQKKMFAKK